jgi:excisionase family DNA binding protein
MTRTRTRIIIPEPEILLNPAETAEYFRVGTKTLSRWAKEGRIPFIRTLGGHRRYRLADIQRLLQAGAE